MHLISTKFKPPSITFAIRQFLLILTRDKKFDSSSVDEGEWVTACFEFDLNLASGDYLFSFSVSQNTHGELVPLDRRYDSVLFSVTNPLLLRGYADMHATFELIHSEAKVS